ncbi:hypothetical protein C0J52_14531, partial [Blattella germanica]
TTQQEDDETLDDLGSDGLTLCEAGTGNCLILEVMMMMMMMMMRRRRRRRINLVRTCATACSAIQGKMHPKKNANVTSEDNVEVEERIFIHGKPLIGWLGCLLHKIFHRHWHCNSRPPPPPPPPPPYMQPPPPPPPYMLPPPPPPRYEQPPQTPPPPPPPPPPQTIIIVQQNDKTIIDHHEPVNSLPSREEVMAFIKDIIPSPILLKPIQDFMLSQEYITIISAENFPTFSNMYEFVYNFADKSITHPAVNSKFELLAALTTLKFTIQPNKCSFCDS